MTSLQRTLAWTCWRLVVAASGLVGYLAARSEFGGDLHALSQEASLAVAGGFVVLAVVGLVRPGAEWAWLGGALATLLGLVWGTYSFLMGGDASTTSRLFEHVITPGLVVVDFAVLGALRGLPVVPLWWPVTWLLPPLAYLAAYVAGDWEVYDFLDPHDSGFAGTVVGFLIGTLVLAYLLLGARRMVGLVRADLRT